MWLLASVTVASAALLDQAGLGPIVEVDDSLDAGGGGILTDTNNELLLQVVAGGEDARFTPIRAWDVRLRPMQTFLEKERRAWEEALGAWERGEPRPEKPRGKLVVGQALLGLGGRSWADDRLHFDVGGLAILNLLQPAGVPAWQAWVGPQLGALSRVRYALGADRGRGQLLAVGGLGAAAVVGELWSFRLDAQALWEPVAAELLMHGEAVTTLSLLAADAPVAFQVRGHADLDPAAGRLADAGVAGAVLFVVDTGDRTKRARQRAERRADDAPAE